jgi:hypothetical protein
MSLEYRLLEASDRFQNKRVRSLLIRILTFALHFNQLPQNKRHPSLTHIYHTSNKTYMSFAPIPATLADHRH